MVSPLFPFPDRSQSQIAAVAAAVPVVDEPAIEPVPRQPPTDTRQQQAIALLLAMIVAIVGWKRRSRSRCTLLDHRCLQHGEWLRKWLPDGIYTVKSGLVNVDACVGDGWHCGSDARSGAAAAAVATPPATTSGIPGVSKKVVEYDTYVSRASRCLAFFS